jgi:hypothetical protein
MTTERFRFYSAFTRTKLADRAREIVENEAFLVSGVGSRPSGDDFEDAPFSENPYAEGDLVAELGDRAAAAHENAEAAHADQAALLRLSRLSRTGLDEAAATTTREMPAMPAMPPRATKEQTGEFDSTAGPSGS